MEKRILGQFFTKKDFWLKGHIKDFIINSGCRVAYDPFAGNGDILETAKQIGFSKTVGLDIEPQKNQLKNDSLLRIPSYKDAIIITNPPYLTNYSARRKKIYNKVERYFSSSIYDDLYLIALDRMLAAQEYVVAIVPETFINNSFLHKPRLVSITVIEDNCFNDTENPVCVVCFDGDYKEDKLIKIYKNSKYINTLNYFENLRLKPKSLIQIKFNDVNGVIALRAIDATDPNNMIRFMKKDDLDYKLTNIKHSSRLITVINSHKLDNRLIDKIIDQSNKILDDYRNKTRDILLSPFKGNMKNGIRRRRLDYESARAILEEAYSKVGGMR
ncbi:MAG: hypothetical protein JW803_08570 [Endomicrobiales bacterium]|nr:hypothetical protein [Endomicrobiales bacterium]